MRDNGEVGATPEYALERSDAERRRLSLQDRVIGARTEQFFCAAGLESGMRVLDVGCGVGDVSMLVARAVGSSGTVVGIDVDGPSVETATTRAAAAGLGNVEFVAGDIGTVDLGSEFDAAVGRLVLMHLPDPAAVLRRVAGALRPGGVVAFQEVHLAAAWLSFPVSPTLEQVQAVRTRALARGQPVYAQMGLALRDTFVRAGFPDPQLRSDVVIFSGHDPDGYELIEQTVRSLIPGWRSRGIEGCDLLDPDGLAGRLRDEIGDRGMIMLYPIIGAWARRHG